MTKYVVEYQCDSLLYAVDFDSKESFLGEFEAAFRAWSKINEIRLDKIRRIHAASTEKERAEHMEVFSKWFISEGKLLNALQVGGYLMKIPSYHRNNEGEYKIDYMPAILTLEEWIEAYEPEKLKC